MRALFPILESPNPEVARERARARESGVEMLRAIPWEMIAPHEAQAQANHGQTLARLAERGGLSACEAVAVLEDRPWRKMPLIDAYRRLSELFVAAAEAA